MEKHTESFVAECFWPDVGDADLVELDRRIEHAAAEPGSSWAVHYLGSILLREDEVVLCQFRGAASAVRELAIRAQIPFERILETTSFRWHEHDVGNRL